MKRNILQLLFVVFAALNSANAQSYTVESFEGQLVKIKLTENVSKKSWYLAKVSCLTDSLFLIDFAGVNKVHKLNNKFLEIVYDTRGGSGSQFKSTLILSVKNNKINVALLAGSYGKAFGGDIDGSCSEVKFKLKRDIKSGFKLVAHIYDKHNSAAHPQKSYVRNKNVTLNFDSVQNIFYSTHKNLTQSFNIYDPKTQQPVKQQVSGLLPVITLDGDNYYYIKAEWYKSDDNHTLFKEYYR